MASSPAGTDTESSDTDMFTSEGQKVLDHMLTNESHGDEFDDEFGEDDVAYVEHAKEKDHADQHQHELEAEERRDDIRTEDNGITQNVNADHEHSLPEDEQQSQQHNGQEQHPNKQRHCEQHGTPTQRHTEQHNQQRHTTEHKPVQPSHASDQEQYYSTEKLVTQEDDNDDPLENAKRQWAQVNKLREQQGYGDETPKAASSQESPIRASDAYIKLREECAEFQTLLNEVENDSMNIMEWISKISFGVCGKVPIRKSLAKQRRILLATCQINLDLADETHIRIMGTVYKRLTGDRYNCPMVGSHWENLGFQRPNPQTDLRDAGMFGMVQLLCFLEKGKDVPLDLLHMSQQSKQDFPFCVVSLNMTAIAKTLLRAGKLNHLINKKKSVYEAMNLAYMSIFYDFYLMWKAGDKTIHDYGRERKALEEKAIRNVDKLISRFDKDIVRGPFESAPKQEF